MRYKIAISAYVLKTAENNTFLRFRMGAKEDFKVQSFLFSSQFAGMIK